MSTLQLFNTLTGKKEPFNPQVEGAVSLYTCGPTVYSEPHIGNWVAFVRWDILVRVLKQNDYSVTRVMNVTDVGHLTSDADEGEDKMSKGAEREGVSEWEIADRYTKAFLKGMTALNLLPPEHLVRATDHIAEQIDLVKTLESKGFTYVLNEGVYFDTSKFPSYANFAHLDLEALKAGARVSFNSGKKNVGDFVLWRLTPEGESRTMEWDSPWGEGQPGWHLECSAMAMRYLGETIDIHTGGIDHIPVHHTNEIAQSEAATGKPFADYWLHANFLLSNGTKISKSLENGYTLSDCLEKGFSALDFRMFILQSHYKTETNFSWENIQAAHNRLQRWKEIACLRHQTNDTWDDDDKKDSLHDINGMILAAPHAILEALNDDLATPQALTHIERVFDAIEAAPLVTIQNHALTQLLSAIDDSLGLNLVASTPDIDDSSKQLLLERSRARENGNWNESDRIRDDLASKGILVSDAKHGARWYYN